MPQVSVEAVSNVVGKNPPGLKRIFLAAVYDVASIPAHTNYSITTDITMVVSKTFVELEFSRQSGASLNVEEQEAEDTTGYMYTLDGFIGGCSPELYAALDKLANNPVIAICEDKDGVMRIAGELGRGLKFRLNLEDGKNAGTRRGVVFEAKMDFGHLPYFYTGVVPLT